MVSRSGNMRGAPSYPGPIPEAREQQAARLLEEAAVLRMLDQRLEVRVGAQEAAQVRGHAEILQRVGRRLELVVLDLGPREVHPQVAIARQARGVAVQPQRLLVVARRFLELADAQL